MLETNKIYNMNCLEGLKLLDDNSIDSIVTDPPYELGFMGKKWDNTGISYNVDLWKECLRVLKPGGHLLSFGGSRTYHRMACAIEDAGFEIRDQIMWVYGSGFPKSRNISKDMDIEVPAAPGRKAISKREKVKAESDMLSQWHVQNGYRKDQQSLHLAEEGLLTTTSNIPVSENAIKWDGWGTCLKPAHEPIVVARKPLSEKKVADNVLKWNTGGINIDDCRIELNGDYKSKSNGRPSLTGLGDNYNPDNANKPDDVGRFPANIIFDKEAGRLLDEQSGTLKSGKNATRKNPNAKGYHGNWGTGQEMTTYGDSGGASRFFYCAKSSKKERGEYNSHPTVKPLSLIKYLVTLVTPLNGICLDPFEGSGTHALSCKELGFNYIGFEMEDAYCEIAMKRIKEAVNT